MCGSGRRLGASLDGYAAVDGWPGFWALEGSEYLAWLDEPAEQHAVLMGATTYRLMSKFAAENARRLRLRRIDRDAEGGVLLDPGVTLSWANTELVDRDPVEAVQAMKRDASRPMRTLGSLILCRSLLEAGLMDRLRVVLFPVITGATGRERIFDGYPDVALELVANRTSDGRLQLREYVSTVLDAPPGGGEPTGADHECADPS